MASRGGRQRIPRPPTARPGAPAPWTHLRPEQRRFTLADVRAACARLASPRRPLAPVTARPAAVLVACFDAPDEGGRPEARILLTKRPDTMPSHQGEIAFPGGKLEPGRDATLREAALREAREEIGLEPAAVEVVAELDSLTTVASRFVLSPFVGLLSTPPVLTPDPSEVVCVLDVAVSELLDDAAYREERWDLPRGLGSASGRDRSIHFFELEGETVWGATARILADFLERLTATR